MGTEEEHSQLSPLTGAESRHNQDVVMETTATTSVPMVIPGNHAQVQFIHIVPHQEGRHETVMGETLLEESSPIEAPILTALDTSMLTDTSILTDTSAIQLSIIDQSSPRSTHTQASEASKEFTFRLQIANDDDVKIKSPTGIHLQDYDKFQLERLMQDAIKRANYSESSDVDLPGVSEEKMIQDFMNRHVTSDLQMKADISVKDLRRIIPILIMQLFNIREERTQKKVKGLWTERPKGWPDNIPYSDPNNQTKDGPGKPKKEILKKMFDFLLVKYREHIGGHWPNGEQPHHSWSAEHQPAWPSEQQLPSWSDSATTGSQPMEQSDLDPATSIASSSSPASSLPVTMVTKLEKVEDNEEWVTELLERIQSKVAYVEKDIYMDDKTKGLLSIIRDLLTKMYEIRNDDEIGQFFVTSGHNFEATLDIVRLKQEMPKDHQRRWEEFQAKWYVKIVSLANQVQGGSEISQAEALTTITGQ